MDQIQRAVGRYSDCLAPIREAVGRYLKYPSSVNEDGVMNVGHRPWEAPESYMFRLFPGIQRKALVGYAKAFQLEIPKIYVEVLRELNGAFCFGMSLYGIPPSMLGNPPLLDRKRVQCLDLSRAKGWTAEYHITQNSFHFGGRHFSYEENVGYFMDGEDRIRSVRKGGKVVAEWTSLAAFLKDELAASEKLEEELNPSQWKKS
jgi:hypothetical protein